MKRKEEIEAIRKSLTMSVHFEPGHNCRDYECKYGSKTCKPGSGGYHGISDLSIRFILKGEHGAVQFHICTDWIMEPKEHYRWGERGALPAVVGYHWKTPLYEGQTLQTQECPFLDGEPCYYNGSGLEADAAMQALVLGGEPELRKYLESCYLGILGINDGYTLPEYPTPERSKK